MKGGLDAEVPEEKLKLTSGDNETFEVDKKITMQSELIKTMVEGGMQACLFRLVSLAVSP